MTQASGANLIKERAITLLGQNLDPSMVASAIGITPAYISQLISDPEFSARVAEIRFKTLASHTDRDRKYDSLEDRLLEKLENMLSFMVRPTEVLRAIATINAAKRRGAPMLEATSAAQQETIPLSLPHHIFQQFTAGVQNIQVNINNQVIKVGDRDMITIQTKRLDDLLKTKESIHDQNANPPPTIEYSKTP